MKRSIMIALLGLMAAAPAMAQEKEREKVKEEVIIKKKGGGDEKTTIIIDGDKITVNGKPLTEYGGNDIIIRKRELNDLVEMEMRGVQREMELAQRDMQRAMIEMKRSSPRAYQFRMEPGDFDFDLDFNEDIRVTTGEPRAYLGVGLDKAPKGVRITETAEGSAAAKAGLKKDDVITKFAGKEVGTPEQLTEMVRSRKPNDEVEISYVKAGEKKERKMKVKLGEASTRVVISERGMGPGSSAAPGSPRAPRAPRPPMAPMYPEGEMMPPIPPMPPMVMEGYRWNYSGGRQELGLRIQDTDETNGVKVLDVNEGSLAAGAGVKENDVITEINGKTIKNTDDAREALRDVKDSSSYSLKLLRNGSPMNVEVKVPKKLKKADL